MNIEWNRVTWYSKMLALILFVALPFIGFYYGAQYGSATQTVKDVANQIGTGSSTTSGSDYYSNPATWQTDTRSDAGFSLAYPIDFDAQDNSSLKTTTDWRLNSNNVAGLKEFTLTIPRAFEPQTNFADATLTVGLSRNPAALADCLTPDQSDGPTTSTSTMMVNNAQFTVFHSSSAGAGNLYQTTSYRTTHGGQCYAVEYTIHSSQIANYPASYNLKPFDQAAVTSVLDRIVGTFKFL